MKADLIFKAIKQIYPQIEGGFSYWENQINPEDGLVWENKEYPKPTWKEIEALIPQVELQKAKEEKIAEIKRINDEKNIEPSTAQAYIIKENGTLGELVSFKFKTTRHPSNPASDPNTILFNTIAFKKTTRYSTTNQETGEQIAIQLTPQIAESIGSHLAVRNTNNFQNRDELLAKIKEAKTIEEIEAIKWESK
jgi:hypothetical protein